MISLIILTDSIIILKELSGGSRLYSEVGTDSSGVSSGSGSPCPEPRSGIQTGSPGLGPISGIQDSGSSSPRIHSHFPGSNSQSSSSCSNPSGTRSSETPSFNSGSYPEKRYLRRDLSSRHSKPSSIEGSDASWFRANVPR